MKKYKAEKILKKEVVSVLPRDEEAVYENIMMGNPFIHNPRWKLSRALYAHWKQLMNEQ